MKIAGISFRVHPLFLVVLAVAYFGRALPEVLGLFVIVVLHELGHVIAARLLGYQTESIELLPFGGVARLSSSSFGFSPRHETIIAIAGPLVNFLLALLGLLAHFALFISEPVALSFVTVNLSLFFFNLLPGLPLDGGRIARAGLARRRGYLAATKAVIRVSFLLSVVLIAMGTFALWLGYADAGLLLLGVFLLVSAYTAGKQTRYDLLRFLEVKRREKVSAQPLSSFIVNSDAAIGEVAAKLAPGAYHLIYVRTELDVTVSHSSQSRTRTQGVIDEEQLLSAVFEHSMWTERVSALL